VHGDVTTRNGDVTVVGNAVVRGDLVGATVAVDNEVTVDGAIRAREETQLAGTARDTG
jgi:predicted acyltransferase (DUF342 family)